MTSFRALRIHQADNLGLEVVVEGAESRGQVQRLQQGYFFTPALPPEEFTA